MKEKERKFIKKMQKCFKFDQAQKVFPQNCHQNIFSLSQKLIPENKNFEAPIAKISSAKINALNV